MYLSNFESLRRTQRAYYERAALRRRVRDRSSARRCASARASAAIPGVAEVETRVVADVTLDVLGSRRAGDRSAGLDARHATGRALNDLFLRRGRWIDPARPDEVLASEAFVTANRLEPGDRVAAVINGRRRRPARSSASPCRPSTSTASARASSCPTTRRFGVFWMDRRPLGRGVRHGGGLQRRRADAVAGARRARGGRRRPRSPARALRRPRRDSARPAVLALDAGGELAQLQSLGSCCRSIFLVVAAFCSTSRCTRALALQRAADRRAQGARLHATPTLAGTT